MNKFNLIKISLILVIIISCVNCEKFSAISEMEKLAYDEEKIIEEFANFISKMEGEMLRLKRKLATWKDENEVVRKDVLKYITNPITAYSLIKRSSYDLEHVEERIMKSIKLFKAKVGPLKAENEDLEGAINGLFRLQKIYNLKASDIANGIIGGQQTNGKLTDHDMFLIIRTGLMLETSNKFVREYVVELKRRMEDDSSKEDVDSVDEKYIHKFENLVNLNPKNDVEHDTYIKNGVYNSEKETILYSRMCRQEGLKSPKESAALKCRYISNSPFSKIAPFKIEEADHSTNLMLFHDVVYDSEIEVLKNISKTQFIRGTVFGKSSLREKTDQRVAKVAWLKDIGNDVIDRISRRVEDMTGLTMTTSEELQIQNYGIGGHYHPHWDITIKGERQMELGTGNRIATVLFYLSTVEKGGATVFPYLKVYVPAVKGMAAFWYNLKDSGDDDYYTRHAACPVLLGSKWVANKWIHEYGQEFRRPCKPENYIESSEHGYLKEFY